MKVKETFSSPKLHVPSSNSILMALLKVTNLADWTYMYIYITDLISKGVLKLDASVKEVLLLQ